MYYVLIIILATSNEGRCTRHMYIQVYARCISRETSRESTGSNFGSKGSFEDMQHPIPLYKLLNAPLLGEICTSLLMLLLY